jgi:acyl-homoserine lactone synthase
VIEVLSGVLPGENSALDQAFRLRHAVFVEERRWEALRRADGREIDQFDDADAVHLLATEHGLVLGYARLRSTAQPTLLAEVHSFLSRLPCPRTPSVWEWTRYCVRPDRRSGNSPLGPVGSEIIVACVEWSLDHGIGDAVLEIHPAWEAFFTGLSFKVRRLGPTVEMDGEPVVAVQLRFDERTLKFTREARGVHWPVFAAGSARRRVAEMKELKPLGG